jgi:hypothetical protein
MVGPYLFTVDGVNANGQPWSAEGIVICEFHDTFDWAMKQVFDQLTQGRARYGTPGIGCSGPYEVRRVTIVKNTAIR